MFRAPLGCSGLHSDVPWLRAFRRFGPDECDPKTSQVFRDAVAVYDAANIFLINFDPAINSAQSLVMATEPALVTPSGLLRSSAGACAGSGLTSLTLSNRNRNDKAEIILDYGRCEGGLPVFILRSATAPEDQTHVPFEVTYSETINGTNHDRGRLIHSV